ncbi:MAG: hypothetical protein SGPRY_007675, partial [Prymnesium sp.]
VPECGFCRFMRAGPCGDVFTKWENCIDRARDTNADFVELCGAETMELKVPAIIILIIRVVHEHK